MVPTPNTYSLRSHGLPTMNKESPVRTRKVSTKAIENEEIEAQVAVKTVIDAFQPLVNALTSQVAQLSAALEEQRIGFNCYSSGETVTMVPVILTRDEQARLV